MRAQSVLVFCLLLTSCALAERPHHAPQVAEPTGHDWMERIETICSDELTWRFPNSMALTLSDEARGMRLDLVRARVLVGTQDLARDLDDRRRAQLLRSLREIPCDEECRALVHARLLAAAGVPEQEISAARPDLCEREGWTQVIREGLAIRELG